MAEKVKLLFTGLDKAEFKMGDKMLEVAREVVKKYGKENVTLIHGGRPEKSIIDKNIIRLGEGTGLKYVSDALDLSKKNAANIRTQERIDDTSLIQYSFNTKGDLNLKDKYEGYWRDYYEKLGKQTIGKGDVRPEGSLRFPRKKYKKDAQGKPTKDLQSQSTLETTKFKTLLDKVEDDTNLQRQQSGVEFARKKDAWTKENIGFNLITEKNEPRIRFIEGGEGLSSFKREYIAQEQQIYEVSPTTMGRTAWQETGDQQTPYVEDTSDIGREGQSDSAGRRGGASLIRSTKTGKVLEKTKKYKVSGTLLTGKTKKIEQRAGIRYTTYGDPVKGPSGYGSSSLTQFEDIEHAEPNEYVEARKKAIQDPKTLDVGGSAEDTDKSGSGYKRHKASYLEGESEKLPKDIKDLEAHIKNVKSIQRKNKRIQRTGSKQKFIGAKSKAVQRLLKTVPDVLSYDKQSATVKDIKPPKIYLKLSDTTKAGRDIQTIAEIKKGPSPFGYNTSKERAIRDSTTGVVTAKTRSTILTQKKGFQTKLSRYSSLWAERKISSVASLRDNPPSVKSEPTSAMIKAAYKKAQQTFGVSFSKELPLPKPKTILVTSEVTPKQDKVQWWRLKSKPKPSKKAVTSAAKKVTSELQKVFHKPTGTTNVEDKFKKLKFKGKGIKFTRGLGAFTLGSSILGVFRGRKEARKDLGREPDTLETLRYTFIPPKIRKAMYSKRYNPPSI